MPQAHLRTPIIITPAGVVGTLVLALVIAGCVRLGFWQLERRQDRIRLNEGVAARLDAPPLTGAAALADTAGIFYRTVTARGFFDNQRSIILPGRSYRGSPGVYLLSPLRLEGEAAAVLVNRGWLPSPDGATADIAAVAIREPVTVRGLVLPFPGRHESLAQRPLPAPESADFRRTWFSIDETALRGQYPYALMPVTVQELPAPDAPRYPARLEPPPLDEGPHLGYALQWFSFAIIGIIGWVAMLLRGRQPPRSAPPPVPVVVALLILLAPTAGTAQLRPMDPLDWRVFESGTSLTAAVGAGIFREHPATLAGTTGRLMELGNYMMSVRFQRVAVELTGTAIWRMSDEVVRQPPLPGVQPAGERARQDPGFASAATLVDLTPSGSPVAFVLRFGTRLPTTSDETGLDRDRTDFFASGTFRYRTGGLSLTAENGVGIHGTVDPAYPQSDVWMFSFGAEYEYRSARMRAGLVGHQDGHSRRLRGNEDMLEARLRAELGRSRWIAIDYIRGIADASPRAGLRLAAGVRITERQLGKLGL